MAPLMSRVLFVSVFLLVVVRIAAAESLRFSSVLLQHSGRKLSERAQASIKLHPLLTRIADNRFELHSVNAPSRHELRSNGENELHFHATVFGEKLTFLLKPDRDLFGAGFAHHHEQSDGSFITKSEDVDCFFHGTVQGSENSTVSVNFCEDGDDETAAGEQPLPLVSGLVRHKSSLIALQPLRQHGVHVFYHVDAMEKHGDCKGQLPPPLVQLDDDSHVDAFANNNNNNDWDPRRHLTENTARFNGNKIKRVKFLVVNDVARYTMMRGNTHAHSASLMQQVRDMYLALDAVPNSKYQFHIQIVGIVTYAYKDPWAKSLQTNAFGETMSSKLSTAFNSYMAGRKEFPFRMGQDYTTAHLLSGLDFDGSTVGYAMVGGACSTKHATGINQAVGHSDTLVATTIVHELAHNLGAQHTHQVTANSLVSSPCKKDGVSFVMDSSGGGHGIWSTCTTAWFQMHIEGYPFGCKSTESRCLHPRSYDILSHPACMEDSEESASFAALPVCGNGLVESGEECDCGEGGCEGKDPCCDASTCQLVNGATCSALDDCCDTSTCLIVSEFADVVCRRSKSSCDIEEKCNGRSATCPADAFLMGSSCEDSKFGAGSCFQGECRVRAAQCDTLSGVLGTDTQYQVGNCVARTGGSGNAVCRDLACNPVGSDEDNCILFERSGVNIKVLDGTPCSDQGDVCLNQMCVPASELKLPTSLKCSNGVLDADEADVDCGGECFPCSAGKSCFSDMDCFNATDNPSRCEFATTPVPTMFLDINSTDTPALEATTHEATAGGEDNRRKGECRTAFTPPPRVFVPGRSGFLGHWDDFVAWVQSNLQLSIPLLIAGGLIVLWVLLTLVECMCCQRRRARQRAKKRASMAKFATVSPAGSRRGRRGRDVNPLPRAIPAAQSVNRTSSNASNSPNSTRTSSRPPLAVDVEAGVQTSGFVLWSPSRAIAAVAAAARTPTRVRRAAEHRWNGDGGAWDQRWDNASVPARTASPPRPRPGQSYEAIYAASLARQTSPRSSSSSGSNGSPSRAKEYPGTMLLAQQPSLPVTPPRSPRLSAAARLQQQQGARMAASNSNQTRSHSNRTRSQQTTSPERYLPPKCNTCRVNFANPLRSGMCIACHHAQQQGSQD